MAKYERFHKPPKVMNLPEKPRISMFDRHIAAIKLQQEAKAAQIATEEELHKELYDFSYQSEVDEYGFPKTTPYQVPDSVPDVWSAPSVEETEKKAEPEVSPSVTENNS